jgi:response regulator of citrate/malate metabolism
MPTKPEIHIYMTGFDRCQVDIQQVEVADVLITAAMEHDPKIATMVFFGVVKYMKLHNFPIEKMQEMLSMI